MKILVDADSCPVKAIIEDIAKQFQIPVLMLVDTSHQLQSSYSEIITVSKAPDAVDLALVNRIQKGDIAVTQDYGVAAMVLAKGAFAIHPKGRLYTEETIDHLLLERYISKKQRRSGKYGIHVKKRTHADDDRFYSSFFQLCMAACKEKET